jgi:hypothetical protein
MISSSACKNEENPEATILILWVVPEVKITS